MEEAFTVRKIRKDELEAAARIIADAFIDYPVYGFFFPDRQKRFEQLYYMLLPRMYSQREYTYVSEDMAFIASCKKPGDKDSSVLSLVFGTDYVFKALRCINPFLFLPKFFAYQRMKGTAERRYYDKNRDQYLQSICIKDDKRSMELLRKGLAAVCSTQMPVYADTHTKALVRLYRHFGAEVVFSAEWKGLTHCVIRREASENGKTDKEQTISKGQNESDV